MVIDEFLIALGLKVDNSDISKAEKFGDSLDDIKDGADGAESYQDGYYFRENPEFQFHNGIHAQWNLTDNNGAYFKKRGFNPIRIDDLRTELAKREPMDLRDVDIPHGTIVLEK